MPTLHEQIKALIQLKNTQEALHLFAQSGHPDAAILQGRYDLALQLKSTMPKEDETEWQITLNRIHFALLEMSNVKPDMPEPSGDLPTQIRELVAKGDTQAALYLLRSSGDQNAEILLDRLKKAQLQFTAQEINYSRLSHIIALINNEIIGGEKSEAKETRPSERPMPDLDPAQKISIQKAAPEIRQAIGQGKLKETIDLIVRTEVKESVPFYHHFTKGAEQYKLGLIESAEWLRLNAQLYQEILTLDWMRESDSSILPGSALRIKILEILQNPKLDQAFILCQGLGDQFLMLSAQFATAKKLFEAQMITAHDFERQKNRLHAALQMLLEQVPKEVTKEPGLLDKFRRLFG